MGGNPGPVPGAAVEAPGPSGSVLSGDDVCHFGPWLAISVGKLGTAVQLVVVHAYLVYWLPQASAPAV